MVVGGGDAAGEPGFVFFGEDDCEGEEEEEEDDGGGEAVLGLGEVGVLLDDDHEHEEGGEGKGDVEEVVEDLELVGLPDGGEVADGAEEGERDGGGEPADEEDEGFCVVVVEGVVELGYDGAAESDVAFQDPQNDAAALREVLHARH